MFWNTKLPIPMATWTPNPRIHTKCSNSCANWTRHIQSEVMRYSLWWYRYLVGKINIPMFNNRGRLTYICISKVILIGSDNGLSAGRLAIIWTNAGVLLNGNLGTKLNEIFSEIHTFSFTKMHLKMSSRKCRPRCYGFNVLTVYGYHWYSNDEWMSLRNSHSFRDRKSLNPGPLFRTQTDISPADVS